MSKKWVYKIIKFILPCKGVSLYTVHIRHVKISTKFFQDK